MSQVWVNAYLDKNNENLVRFYGDCDTSIIKGVLAILIGLTEGKSVDEIMQLDMDDLFAKLKLEEHLSPQRHVGVYAIVELIKKKAQELKHK
jgi:cysteine desulfuration protein SufE